MKTRVDELFDVIVIGGGLSGLAAGVSLTDAQLKVVVVEASDTLGGRTLTQSNATYGPRDYGAEFIGTSQCYMQHFIQRFRVKTYETYLPRDKDWLYQPLVGKITRISGADPLLVPGGDTTLVALSVLDRLSLRVRLNIERPEELPADITRYDSMTAQDWIDTELPAIIQAAGLPEPITSEVFASSVRALFSVEPHQISMLYLLYYAATAGGYAALVDTTGGRASAQGYRFTSGTGSLVSKLAEFINPRDPVTDLCPNTVRTSHRVVHIESDATGSTVSVQTPQGLQTWRAKKVIVAVPPQVCGSKNPTAMRFTFKHSPGFDPSAAWKLRESLCDKMFVGRTIKGFTAFTSPFWRYKKLMGRALSSASPANVRTEAEMRERPIDWAIDDSWEPEPFDDSKKLEPHEEPLPTPLPKYPFALMTFIVGDSAEYWAKKSQFERSEAVKQHLTTLFGDEVGAAYIAYDDHDFAATRPGLIGGCPSGILGKNALTTCGSALRHPVGPLHWASTESATEWCGYMDGALQSGMRAASEVIAALQPPPPVVSPTA